MTIQQQQQYIEYYISVLREIHKQVSATQDPINIISAIYKVVGQRDAIPMDTATYLVDWLYSMIDPHPNLYYWIKMTYGVEVGDEQYRQVNLNWLDSMIYYLSCQRQTPIAA